MEENRFSGVALRAIEKGRDLGEVLTSYMSFYRNAQKVANAPGKYEEKIFAEAMQGAVYRIYLLGVEDGMKEMKK